MPTLDESLYGFLGDADGVGDAVSDGASPATYRIFPVFAGENPQLPCLVYRTISATREISLDGPLEIARERVQIDVVASSYTSCRGLADAVRTALDGFSGDMGGLDVHYAHLQNIQDFYDADAALSRISMDFIITYIEGA